jgi:hypothetical protein
MYSFSVQGKHLRNLTISSRSGPTNCSAKIFTVRGGRVKLVGIIFWMTDEHIDQQQLDKMCCPIIYKNEKKKTIVPERIMIQ